MPIGIVAPKVAGSSPVGHPPRFRIDKPNSQKAKESRYKHRGLLTPLWHHSGEVREVWGRQLGPQNWYDPTVTVEVHPLEWGRHTRVLEVGTVAKGISGVTVSRKATYKYSTVMPTLNMAAPRMTP